MIHDKRTLPAADVTNADPDDFLAGVSCNVDAPEDCEACQ